MPKSGGRWCAARYCSSNCVKCKDLSFFSFPKDEERCKKWVANCKRQDLLSKKTGYLNKNCFLCSKHFENTEFLNFLKNRLKPEAVPTLFETSKAQNKTNNESRLPKGNEQLIDSIEALSYDNFHVEESFLENTCGSSSVNQLIICPIDSPVVQTEDTTPYYPITTETNSQNVTNYPNSIYQVIVDPSKHENDSVEAIFDVETLNHSLTNSALAEILLESANVETVEVSPSTSILEQYTVLINNVDNRKPSRKSLAPQSILKPQLPANDCSTSAKTACLLKINDNNGQNQNPKSILKPIELTNVINNVNKDHNYLSLKTSSPRASSIKSIKNSLAHNLGNEGNANKIIINPSSALKVHGEGPPIVNPSVSKSPNINQKSSMTFLIPLTNLQFESTVLPSAVNIPTPSDPSPPTVSSHKAITSKPSVSSETKYFLKYQNAKKVIKSLRVKCSRLAKRIEGRRISTQQFKLFCDEFLPADVAHFIKTKVKIKRRPLKPCEPNTSNVETTNCQSEPEANKTDCVHNEENMPSVQVEIVGDSGEVNLVELSVQDKSKNKTLNKCYSCDLCAFATDKKFFLNRHKYNQHSTDRPFKCDQCDYRAKTQKILRYHMEIHGEQLYPCTFCTKSYRLKSTYNKHLVRVHKQRKKILSCHLCTFQTRFLTTFKKHLLEEHQIESEDANLSDIIPSVISVTKECPYCDCQLKNNAVFEDHLAVKHQVDKDGNPAAPDKFKCKHCEFSCVARFQLSNHYHLKHGRKWTCEICEFTCNQKSKLDSHIKFRHLGIKAFVCDTCGYQLASINSLKQHMFLRHEPKENHTCSLCLKSFNRRLYLQKHMRLMHSDVEVRHTCPYCEFSARLKGNLNQHIHRKHKSDNLFVLL